MRRLFVLVLFLAVVVLGRESRLIAEVRSMFEPGGHASGAHLPPVARAPVCGRRCGVERWAVKTLSDPQRHRVNLTAVPVTIEALTRLHRSPAPSPEREAPVELTTYVIEGYLGAWHGEADGDLHMVLFDPANQRLSLIAEIPDPLCSGACASGLSERFARARAVIEAAVQQPNREDKPIRLRVTGVGFFDREHGQSGAAPNGIELHPVLAVEVR